MRWNFCNRKLKGINVIFSNALDLKKIGRMYLEIRLILMKCKSYFTFDAYSYENIRIK